jgi:tetratricopeptide (TPR) repeat protein
MYIGMILTGKGDVLEKLGDHEEALKTFDKAVESFPENAHAWKGKGNALNSIGRYDEAVKAYDKAIELIPQPGLLSAYSWHGKGLALKALGRSSEADAAFAKAKQLGYNTSTVAQENTAEDWYKTGQYLNGNGSWEEAVKAYDRAIDLEPNNATLYIAKVNNLNMLAFIR